MNDAAYMNYNQVTQEEMETILMLTRKMDGGDNGNNASEQIPSPYNELQEGTHSIYYQFNLKNA
jgi:hypothetical protein